MVCIELKNDSRYTVAILMSISFKVTAVTLMQYGTVYMTNCYESMKIDDAD